MHEHPILHAHINTVQCLTNVSTMYPHVKGLFIDDTDPKTYRSIVTVPGLFSLGWLLSAEDVPSAHPTERDKALT